jgi:RNA polymerase sigma-70 factor (ECF subfamily)
MNISNKIECVYVNIVASEGNTLKGTLSVTRNGQPSETELVTRAQAGDRNAFNELVRSHAQGVMNVVYRMCGDMHIAEDASQETFIRAWLQLPSYRPKSSLRSWLYRIAVNTAIDMLRKEKRILPQAVEDLVLADAGPGPEAVVAGSERAQLVKEAVLALPDASRAVLVLREYEGLSYRQIADALDIPVGTVMSRLSYARSLLKEKLSVHLFMVVEAENV